MSGGVDSSVAATILKEQGYDVAGVTLNMLTSQSDEASSNIKDASAVCKKLGIDHHIFDLSQEFNDCVIFDFVNKYFNAETPNPCIICNKCIKFGTMIEKALELGFDKIATGHYAVIKQGDNGRYLLCRGTDRAKDQTYVLYSMTQKQLSHTLFPLGEVSKPEVRQIAQRYSFINADKPDSQDICFVPDGDYAAFIEKFTNTDSLEGDFTDINGVFLGRHKGIIRYTIGQRKGLGIALGKPAFVIEKDADKNTVIIGDEEHLFYKRILVKDLNFIPFDNLKDKMSVTAKLRYRHNEQPAVIYPNADGTVIIEFDQPQRAPSPGQAAVFYDGNIVVGGGTIVKGID